MIKKFSSPKIKIWFEPMFFSGFFCGFERCGSATFSNFRGGIFSEKCVRTIYRILHHKEKVWYNEFKPHRSKPQKNPEKNIGSNHILILGEENFLII